MNSKRVKSSINSKKNKSTIKIEKEYHSNEDFSNLENEEAKELLILKENSNKKTKPQHNKHHNVIKHQITKRSKDCISQRICDIDETPDFLIDNVHVKSGYRVNFSTAKCLLKSLFKWHNETVNVWSHLLGTIFVVALVIYTSFQIKTHQQLIYSNIESFKSESKQMLYDFAFTFKNSSMEYYNALESNMDYYKNMFRNISCIECIQELIATMSEYKAHLVQNIEENIGTMKGSVNKQLLSLKKQLIEKIDSDSLDWMDIYHKQLEGKYIFSISKWPVFVYLAGAICCLFFSAAYHLLFLHSERIWKLLAKFDYAGISILICASCYPPYYYYFYCESNFSYPYLTFVTIASIITFLATFTDGFDKHHVFKGLLFLCLGASCLIPFLHLRFIEVSGLHNGNYSNLIYGLICYVVGLAINLTRFPEKVWPGKFCYMGSSHQLWHVLIVLAIYFHYYGALDAYHNRLDNAICPLV